MQGPLTGIRVLDFTRYQQGPYATLLLADMGADVIKVEDPAGGDYGRRMWREPDGYSGFWEALNRGKRSICIDLRNPQGVDLALELSTAADVLVENFRNGVMEAWGLGYDALRAHNPRLVYAQATGWGTRGPLSHAQSFDQIAQAFSGFAQHQGGGPGHVPEVPFPGIADQTGAMNLALGIMFALFARERTGRGQKVEVSLLGSQLALQAPELQHFLHFGRERPREFRASPTVGHYQCSDGQWVMIVGIDQKFWPRLLHALDLTEIEDDPRFARGFGRWSNREALQPIIEARFRQHPSAYWLDRLRQVEHPAGVVQDYATVTSDPQVLANDYIVEQQHPQFGPQRVLGLHIQLSETPGAVGPPPRALGADTRDVLHEAGFDDARIDALLTSGAVAAP
jgi:crotonobetainyl-CoA:carnitine CoA-transferase CaiB-like acyl-CoA transferase